MKKYFESEINYYMSYILNENEKIKNVLNIAINSNNNAIINSDLEEPENYVDIINNKEENKMEKKI
jgi:hypothetical protein